MNTFSELNKTKKHITDLVLLLLMVGFCFPLSLSGQWGNHNIQRVDDKLNQLGNKFSAKNAIVEDSTGTLWIGTEKGLCKYTGSVIDCNVHIDEDPNSIDGNIISYLFLDSEHLIWAAIQDQGINVFDIYGKKIFDLEYIPKNRNGLLHNRVWGMWEDEDGYIWISYFYGGISRFDRNTKTISHFSIDSDAFLEKYRPKTVVSIESHDTESSTYWLATTRGLVKFNTKTKEHHTFLFEQEIEKKTSESQYNRNKLRPLWARTMCKDSEGNLWIGTYGALVYFNVSKEEYKIFRDVDNEILNSVPGVINYDENHILLSYHKGLALMNIHTHSLITLSDKKDMEPDVYIFCRMYKSSDGCVYLLPRSGKKNGIYRYCAISDMIEINRTGHYISNIAVTDNYIHYHRNPGQIESKHLRTGQIINYPFKIKDGSVIRSIFKRSGDSILVSDVYHMYEYHPESGLTELSKLSQDDVYRHESVYVDSDGDIWNGRQREGLFWYRKSENKVVKLDNKSNPSIVYQDYIVDFLEDEDGDIWIATEQGWTIFDKKTQTTRNYLYSDINTENDINIRTIQAFAEGNDSTIWIATQTNGLIKWNKNQEKVVDHINISDGLASNELYDIELDDNKNLWIATNEGISLLNLNSYQIKNFGREYGIESPAYCIDMDNEYVYAGCSNGYFKLNIQKLMNHDKELPKPIITGFDLYGSAQDSLLALDEGIVLQHDQNFFSFTYASINFVDPHLENYQYRLQGIDHAWKSGKGEQRAGYTNVPPGEYVFQTRVKTGVNKWSEPTSIMINIEPSWYQTIWFKILILASLLLMTILTTRYIIERREKDYKIKKHLAQLETMVLKSQMNPHFIFNSLNSIRYLFMKDEKDKGIKYITKFAKLLRTILHHGDQALVNLEEEIRLTELYIKLEQLRFDDSFTFLMDYGSDSFWKEVKIPPFIIQPIVENAFWHGLLTSKKEEKKLEITIRNINRGYLISIEDNGVGFGVNSPYSVDSELNKTKSYGLKMIQERFDLINKDNNVKYDMTISESKNNDSGALVEITIIEN